MTKEEAIICKVYLNDLDKYHTCNEYKLLMQLIDQEPCEDAISREFLLHDLLLKAQSEKDASIKWLEEYINSLPPVTPQKPVLDKIRDEIKKEIDRDDHADEYCDGYYDGMRKALAIIDKYKSESENKE